MSTTTGTFTKWRADWHRALDARPAIDYFMIRSVVFFLVGIGAVMVMSSTMTWSVLEGATVWNQALRQFMMIAVGLAVFWVALRTRPETVRQLTPWLLLVSVVLLVAVLIPGIGTGRVEVGSQSWIVFGPIRFQPSELAKVAIAVWGAAYLADKRHTHSTARSPYIVYTVVSLVMALLIAAQGDMGMAVNFGIIVLFILFFAGVNMRLIIAAFVAAGAALLWMFLSGGFRSNRFHVYFDALFGHFDDTQGVAFQSYQGFLSLADGSVAGVGVGQSRAKWFYLPEAKNDFIFAIIGEELGLWGGAMVIALFAALGYFGIRAAFRAQNQFQALMAGGLTAGVVSQAFINIGYVIGLLPVTGIQLPMISAGGTSTIITLGSMGLLASVARHEPEAVSAMQSYGRPLFDRLFFLPEPATRRPPVRRSAAPTPRERFGEPVTGSVRKRKRPHPDRRR